LRNDLRNLTGLAAGDLNVIWRRVQRAIDAEEALRDVLPALVDAYGAAAGTLAANWYDDTRDEKNVRRRFRAIIPAARDDTGTQALVGWALAEAKDFGTFQTLIAGGMQRRIVDTARDVLTGSAFQDPSARGWQREGSGECAFCDMLIGRGAVYSEETADFASHDNCHCIAVPAFEGEPRPVKPYTPSSRNITDLDRARVRAWLRDHPNA
jgi:hypothetical protein